jgi:hypothetical protein
MCTNLRSIAILAGLTFISSVCSGNLVAQESRPLTELVTTPIFVAMNVWQTMASSSVTVSNAAQEADSAGTLDDDPEVRAVFDKLIEQTTTTKVSTINKTRVVQKTILQCRGVCVRGRWRWRLVPVVVNQTETFMVQEVQQIVTLAGVDWTSDDLDVGAKAITFPLGNVPKSAGGRASRISEAARSHFNSAIQQKLKDETNVGDTVLALASAGFLPIGSPNGVEQAYVIRAVVLGGAFDRVQIEVLLKEQDQNGTPSQNKTDLNSKAEDILTALVTGLR